MLERSAMGMGALALGSMLQSADASEANPLAVRKPHFAAKAKRVIHLFMNGGPSHVDTFDPKPSLEKYAGKALLLTTRKLREKQAQHSLRHSSFKSMGSQVLKLANSLQRPLSMLMICASSDPCMPMFPIMSHRFC